MPKQVIARETGFSGMTCQRCVSGFSCPVSAFRCMRMELKSNQSPLIGVERLHNSAARDARRYRVPQVGAGLGSGFKKAFLNHGDPRFFENGKHPLAGNCQKQGCDHPLAGSRI